MSSQKQDIKRDAFVINAFAKELKGLNRDVSRVHTILTEPSLGGCENWGPPIHDCKSRTKFFECLLPLLENWNITDQFLFYFAGHGEIRKGEQYCLKVGTANTDFLPFSSLMSELDASGVNRAIIILDACHSGAATEGRKRNSDSSIFSVINQEKIPRGIAIIASSKKTQTSLELPDGSQGIFTKLLCDGIESGLDGKPTKDCRISVEDIVDYISEKLEIDDKYLEFSQRPVFSVHKADRSIWLTENPSGVQPNESNSLVAPASAYVRSSEELRLLYEKTLPSQQPCPNVTIDDIDWELVSEYSGRTHYSNLFDKDSKEDVVSKLKLYSPISCDGRKALHKAAVLCFAERPEDFYPQARAVFVVGSPGDRNFIRKEVNGPLRYQVEKLIELTRSHIDRFSYIADDGLRDERETIDFDVVRELVSNAIAHRDYDSYGTVQVTLTPEAFEIQNPGTFPTDTSWDSFIESSTSYSKPVDSAISLYLSRLLAFEGIGRGFNVFRRYVAENGENSIVCNELPGSITCIRVLKQEKNFLVPIRESENVGHLQDFGDAPDVPVFFGRTEELKILKRWIIREHCRLIVISGIGGIGKTGLSLKLGKEGIGKTDLSVKLARGIQDEFEFVIWKSLRNAPLARDLLTDIIKFLSLHHEAVLPENFDAQVSLLLSYLREHRCLLILDNMESVLSSGGGPGQYRKGYEDYGYLLRAVGEGSHKSCLLVTSREQPIEAAMLSGKAKPIRCLALGGLRNEDAKKIFQTISSFSKLDENLQELVEFYDGNPLALELVAHHINEVFFGDVARFLRDGRHVFDTLHDLLDWHVERCSILEKEVMNWLAINRSPASLSELKEDILLSRTKEELPSILQSLQRRIPVQKISKSFTLPPVMIEHVTERLIAKVCAEVVDGKIDAINNYALIKATSKEYEREAQSRFILEPIINELIEIEGGQQKFEEQMRKLLSVLRRRDSTYPGYAGGNILNMLSQLLTDLQGYDFSHLSIRQAYLSGISLHNINLAYSNVSKCMFYHDFSSICSIVFSPDGRFLATGDIDGYIRLWDTSSYQLISAIYGHTDIIRSVAFSPDGSLIASGSEDAIVKIWNIATEECLLSLKGHVGKVQSVCFNPSERILLSSSDDKTIRQWDTVTGENLCILTGHTERVRSVAFSPSGQMIAGGSDDETVKIWERTNQISKPLQGHTGGVTSIAFSPDERKIASSSDDGTVKIWDVDSSQCISTLFGHRDKIKSIAFSFGNGDLLASGGEDCTIKIWDVNAEKCLQTIQGHADSVDSIAFSPDNNVIATSSRDETIRFWEVKSGLCIRVLRGFGISRTPKPYEAMDITGTTGLTKAQKMTLKALGAVET